jgi:hypothetical protein
MEEVYCFTAQVAERWPNEIQIIPDDEQAFVDYLQRARLECDPYWHGPAVYVTVRRRELVERSEGAARVRHCVQAKQTRRRREMRGVSLEPIAQ